MSYGIAIQESAVGAMDESRKEKIQPTWIGAFVKNLGDTVLPNNSAQKRHHDPSNEEFSCSLSYPAHISTFA